MTIFGIWKTPRSARTSPRERWTSPKPPAGALRRRTPEIEEATKGQVREVTENLRRNSLLKTPTNSRASARSGRAVSVTSRANHRSANRSTYLTLAGAAHITTMRTLREFVPQVRQRDIPAYRSSSRSMRY
jgi:hypothetical protein